MGHSTGAENQLDRLKPTTFGSAEYARDFPKTNIILNLISKYMIISL